MVINFKDGAVSREAVGESLVEVPSDVVRGNAGGVSTLVPSIDVL